eukprot:3674736-Pleurochrysis_carterae.AAC.2
MPPAVRSWRYHQRQLLTGAAEQRRLRAPHTGVKNIRVVTAEGSVAAAEPSRSDFCATGHEEELIRIEKRLREVNKYAPIVRCTKANVAVDQATRLHASRSYSLTLEAPSLARARRKKPGRVRRHASSQSQSDIFMLREAAALTTLQRLSCYSCASECAWQVIDLRAFELERILELDP